MPALCCLALVGCAMLTDLDGEDQLDCAKFEATAPGWLVRSCVMRVSCTPYVETLKIGQCIGKTAPKASAYDRCTSKANSCPDIEACSGYGLASAPQCVGQPDGWHCEGDRAVRCGFGDPYVVDCAFHGSICKLYGGAATNGAWPCAIPASQACQLKGTGYCDGDQAVYCDASGQRWGFDCAKSQQRCVAADGESFCSNYTEACEPAKNGRCDGDKIATCTTAGLGLIHDCDTASGRCEYGSCVPAGCKQIPFQSKCTEKCLDATRMQVCVFWNSLGSGQPLTVDCKDHGMERCEMRDDPDSSRDFAVCR